MLQCDGNPAINPGAVEVCGNKVDDNCNGVVDESVCYACLNATNLKVISITATSAQISWSAIANPVQWQLQYKTTNQGSKWVDVLLTGNLRSYKLTSLLSNQNYQVQIRAKCGNTWTSYSATQSFKTVSSSQSVTQKTISLTEVEEKSSAIKLYPNPTNGRFMLELQVGNRNNSKAQIQLIDMFGRTVYSEETKMNNGLLQKSISVSSSLAHGIYLIRVAANDKIYKAQVVYGK